MVIVYCYGFPSKVEVLIMNPNRLTLCILVNKNVLCLGYIYLMNSWYDFAFCNK